MRKFLRREDGALVVLDDRGQHHGLRHTDGAWLVWRIGAQDNSRPASKRLHIASGAWLRATPVEARRFEALALGSPPLV